MKNKTKKNRVFLLIVSVIVVTVIASLLVVYLYSDKNGKVLDTYMACGCGGCGGEPEHATKYYSKSKGEEDAFNKDVQKDRETPKRINCTVAGCSLCTKLVLVE